MALRIIRSEAPVALSGKTHLDFHPRASIIRKLAPDVLEAGAV